MRALFVSVTLLAVLATACSDEPTSDGQPATSTTQPREATTPPTTGEFGNTIEKPSRLTSIDFDALKDGQTIVADWEATHWGIGYKATRYLPDRQIGTTGSGIITRSQFPNNWTVFVQNDEAHDGPRYTILNVRLRYIDDLTIEMRDDNSGDLIANFVFDETDPADWES